MRKTAMILLATALVALAATPLAAAPTDKALTATGTIVRVQATARTVVVKVADGGAETTFVWNDDTKITGVLSPGQKVTIRYTSANGANVASQITVPRA